MSEDRDYISIYERTSEQEYEEAADATFSYFPVVEKTGEKDEDGKPIEIVSYARHKYLKGQEMLDYLAYGSTEQE